MSIEMVFPVAMVIILFALVIGSAAVAFMPSRHEQMDFDRE